MIRQTIRFGSLIILLGLSYTASAQIKREKKADKEFEQTAYINAIDVYKRIADKGYVNTSILENLADAYYFNGKFADANKWYTELFDGNYNDKDLSKITSEYYYRYAQTLKSVGEYTKANTVMDQFVQLEKNDSRAALYEKNKDYLKGIENRSDRFELKPLSINSSYSDYGATILGDDLIFTSARATENASPKEIHSWTNESFTTLYSSKILSNGTFEKPVLFDKKMDSHVNEATAVFTKDGNTMYFTRNNAKSNGRSKQNKQDVSVLKIFKSTKQENGSWGDAISLSINSDNYNTAHPALTPDEKWLYFVSDRPGSKGQSDLYRVGLLDQGQLGPVENLGDVINTAGRETFPFISSNYELYFSSNGHPGLGGLDVFVSKIYPNGTFGPVVNMGEPINSGYDDFAFYFDPKTKKGFVSSNRSSIDDIYFVAEKPCQGILEGKVFDKDSNEVLANVELIITDAMYQKKEVVYSDANGKYVSSLADCNSKYRIATVFGGYNTVEVSAIINPNDKTTVLNIGIEKTEKEIGLNDDLFKKLKLEPIYFDFDKSTIRPDAAIELMKIVEVMKQYPTMIIDVRSHTDSRGNAAYNLALSDRRAKSTVAWMIKQGISKDRLTYKGYGESDLLNNCKKGVPCTAAEHQLNRRSEFIITKM